MNRAEQEREQKVNQNRWRWTFQRSHDREQMRHQLPIIKIHSSNKEYILPSTDEIDRVDFNPVDYINQLFPTEQSLANIDEVIGSVKSKVRSLDTDIRFTIRAHSDIEIDEHKALVKVQNSILLLLFQQMREIKDKANKSEEMAKEITRDIKQLDVAKKNLTTSKSYGDIANLPHPVISVLEHFQPYMNIPQIQELSANVKELTVQITVQVRKECEDAFNGPNAKMLFEGPLSKWTNVIQGWQYRFFVLDPTQGMLIYYTSKENMVKGERRGVVLLRGAYLGIDSEDDSTFTIRSHGKTFHFQARDAEEREKWISNLEEAISLNSVKTDKLSISSTSLFERKISEADAYLQLLIDQVYELEQKSNTEEDTQELECYRRVIASAKRLIEAVKYSIVSLQLAKVHMDPHSDVKADVDYQAVLSHMNLNKGKRIIFCNCIKYFDLDKILRNNAGSSNIIKSNVNRELIEDHSQDNASIESLDFHTAAKTVRKNFPVSSYSSSDDDDDFYDADETME
ncbi:unnamed protein product [Rotaria sp. Silwood1]|nr:unnamed protein product [Rotaria sp. Silwood1]